MSLMSGGVVVVGCTSGLGRAIIRHLINNHQHVGGIHMIARNISKLAKIHQCAPAHIQEKITYQSLDVTHGGLCYTHLNPNGVDEVYFCVGRATFPPLRTTNRRDNFCSARNVYKVYGPTVKKFVVISSMITCFCISDIFCEKYSFCPLPGYGDYAASKMALTRWAARKRNVQVFVAPTMQTEGYQRENQTKPLVSLLVEELFDSPKSPTECAKLCVETNSHMFFHSTKDSYIHFFLAHINVSFNIFLLCGVICCICWMLSMIFNENSSVIDEIK